MTEYSVIEQILFTAPMVGMILMACWVWYISKKTDSQATYLRYGQESLREILAESIDKVTRERDEQRAKVASYDCYTCRDTGYEDVSGQCRSHRYPCNVCPRGSFYALWEKTQDEVYHYKIKTGIRCSFCHDGVVFEDSFKRTLVVCPGCKGIMHWACVKENRENCATCGKRILPGKPVDAAPDEGQMMRSEKNVESKTHNERRRA